MVALTPGARYHRRGQSIGCSCELHCLKRTTQQDVKPDTTFRIPLIDFSKYRAATSLSEKRRTADEIVSGFKEVGFIYLDKHGIPESTVKHTFQKVRPSPRPGAYPC